MGEQHDVAAQIMLEQIIVSRMQAQRSDLMFAYESSHNYMENLIQENVDSLQDNLIETIKFYDRGGQKTLNGYLGFYKRAAAPVAANNLLALCHEKNITTSFNDAAQTAPTGVLDLSDPETASVVKGFDFLSRGLADMFPGAEVAVRNVFMAKRAMKDASRNQASIILQSTGLAHVFGNARDGFLYKESLCATYKAAGARVLPLFVTSEVFNTGVNTIPKGAYKDLVQSVIVDGLADNTFYTKKYASRHRLPYAEGAEEAFFDRVRAASGNDSGLHVKYKGSQAHQEGFFQHADDILQIHTGIMNPALKR